MSLHTLYFSLDQLFIVGPLKNESNSNCKTLVNILIIVEVDEFKVLQPSVWPK